MKVEYIINNYTLGARKRMTPIECIIEEERLDRNHTRIIYDFLSIRQKEFVDKVYAKQGKEIVTEEIDQSTVSSFNDAMNKLNEIADQMQNIPTT